MRKKTFSLTFVPLYGLIFLALLFVTLIGSKAVTVIYETMPLTNRHVIVIDAGHGGEDGGATSCTGIVESQLNLQIALRLNDLLHLLGYQTRMIRTEDVSVYTIGDTIAAKKISDLKERVRIVNCTENAVLLSIHQNYFTDDRYNGAQVFYSSNRESEILAKSLQQSLVKSLNPGSNRRAKKSSGIYLMEHIQCPGALIECGFLSNPEEESKLCSEDYQKKLCCVVAVCVGNFLLS